jgi:hypothetical protein
LFMRLAKSLAWVIGLAFGWPKSRKSRAVGLGLFSVVLSYVGLLTFPGVLFAHYHEHGAFRVWSDEPINPSIAAALDIAEARLANSPIHDPQMVHRLFICNDPLRMKFFARGTQAFGVTYAMRHNTFLNRAELPADRIFRNSPEQNERPLSSVIAHERIHALLLSHYGLMTEYFLPTWKKEGYCEYIGGHPSFDYEEGKRLIRERRASSAPAFRYFEFYLMVKYLLDVEHRSLDELISTTFDEDEVRASVREAIDRL